MTDAELSELKRAATYSESPTAAMILSLIAENAALRAQLARQATPYPADLERFPGILAGVGRLPPTGAGCNGKGV